MMVACCSHAFTIGVDCDSVYCYPGCLEKASPAKGGGPEAETRQRGGGAVRQDGAERDECGAHTKEDLNHSRIGTQENYRRDQILHEDGHESIVKYCYCCGKIL